MPRATIARHDATHPLPHERAEAVLALADAAADNDGAQPLSEQFRLSVRAREHDGVDHLLALADDGSVVGYAQSRAGDDAPSGELVVAPSARRSGVGTALLEALPDGIRLWSHAVGAAADAATGFAEARGLVPVRSLHVMGRSLTSGDPWPEASIDARYAVRTFEPGRDEDAWLALNAAAFAHHPEQGSLRRADLDQRMAQPWWDPAGLILVVEAADPDVLAASHWTKVDSPTGDVGEVYVVAVSPDRQGEGLGRAVTVLGLDHLRSLGLDRVVLYVDEENVAAVRTYRALGFADVEVHRQYARG
jgi:mycothiol synthase